MRSVLFRVCLALVAFVPAATSAAEFVRGDADGNGTVQLTDPIRVLNQLFAGGEASVCDDATDADDDGAVNVTDAVYALNFLFSGGGAPPAPFPTCGDDPTADDLGCSASEACAEPVTAEILYLSANGCEEKDCATWRVQSTSEESLASDLDLSLMELDEEDEDGLRREIGLGFHLVFGHVEGDGEGDRTVVVTSIANDEGFVFDVEDNGMLCLVPPCPVYDVVSADRELERASDLELRPLRLDETAASETRERIVGGDVSVRGMLVRGPIEIGGLGTTLVVLEIFEAAR